MNKYIIIAIIIIFCVIISGCITSTPKIPTDTHLQILWKNYYNDDESITKIYIPEDNITCYAFDNYYGGGISCIKNI